jgi:type IV secretory pathway TrbD component
MADFDDKAPPAGEDIHLPGPSILPLLVAIAVTCSIIGLTLSIWFSIFGVSLFIITVGLWIRDVRRDVDDLPEEHHSH